MPCKMHAAAGAGVVNILRHYPMQNLSSLHRAPYHTTSCTLPYLLFSLLWHAYYSSTAAASPPSPLSPAFCIYLWTCCTLSGQLGLDHCGSVVDQGQPQDLRLRLLLPHYHPAAAVGRQTPCPLPHPHHLCPTPLHTVCTLGCVVVLLRLGKPTIS